MSRIKDLEIRGIRNFGDESAKARIHFSKPLTLILGPNGTGKTTIIEALKYVTSGEYPPDSDKGKSFVHEPKLTQNHTVRGQVKAKIVDKNGRELIITRTMQVTRQKNNALKFQSLDNTITRMDKQTNKKVQISNRCADIDREMLIAMGVSQPILEYVIFCHQEESSWPLEDGKKLKDRFDEIFDTSKYNKAMDSTTKLIKDLQVELNTIKAYEKGLKDMVEEVNAQEEKLKADEVREQETKSRVTEINDSMNSIDNRIQEIVEIKNEYQKLEEKIKNYEIDYKVTNNYIQSIKKHIKQLHKGTKEELLEMIDTYDVNLTQKVTKKQNHQDELEEIESKESNLIKKLAETRIKLGSLTQKKIVYDEKLTRRNILLKKALKTWEIPQMDSKFTEEEVESYLNQIMSKFNEFTLSMKNRIKENEQEERHVQREVDTCRTEKTGIESEISLKEKERSEIKKEINELRAKIKHAGEAGNKLNSIELNLQNASKIYDDLIENFDEQSIKDNLQTEIAKKKELDIKLSQIEQEINSLHKQSAQQAELELHQSSLQDKEENISVLFNKHKNNLEFLFGTEIPKKQLKVNLEKIQQTLSNEKEQLLNQIKTEQQKITKLGTTLKYKKEELSNITAELERYKDKIELECRGNEYNEILLLQERKVKSLQDQRGIYANQSLMYEDFLKQMKRKTCCPLCERGFQNSSEEKVLEKKLYAEIKSSPQNLKQCEEELKTEQIRYDALQQLKPLTEQISELESNKIPQLKELVEKITVELQDSKDNLENLNCILSEPEEKLSVYKKMIGDMTLLDSYMNDKDALEQTVNSKKREMLQAGKIGDRTMQEVQNERQALKKRLAAVENNIESIQSSLQTNQEKLQRAREQRNKLNEEAIHIRESMQACQQLRDKVKDLYSKDDNLEKSLKGLRQNLVVAEEELSIKVEELNKLKQDNRNAQDKDINFKSENATELHELKAVQQEVQNYTNSKIEENLQKIEANVEAIKKESENIKVEKLNLEERIRFLDEQCRSQELGKKDLESNLELLNKKEKLDEVNEQIIKHRSLLENMHFDKIKEEYSQIQDRRDKFEKEKNKLKGAYGELEKSIKFLKANLNQEKYRMARHNYAKNQIQLVIQEEAIANLKEYVKVLDKAMIQFHEERMNTVNKIMRQLWNLVYNGNDTSSIQIRVQTTEGIGSKKRSYNYKLVQVKRSTEMDMKGKCSAGQKVLEISDALASIIIRMALAETFCNDCAILALDEPTTNLDEENAKNLASTLSKVIQMRAQNRRNFQLIVISHDETFISLLSNLSGKQIFHELSRNNNGYSLVKQRDMSNYTKNSSQNDKLAESDDSDEDDEDDEEHRMKSKKRHVNTDSPPPERAFKRRACM